jgi:hypothetical protein
VYSVVAVTAQKLVAAIRTRFDVTSSLMAFANGNAAIMASGVFFNLHVSSPPIKGFGENVAAATYCGDGITVVNSR